MMFTTNNISSSFKIKIWAKCHSYFLEKFQFGNLYATLMCWNPLVLWHYCTVSHYPQKHKQVRVLQRGSCPWLPILSMMCLCLLVLMEEQDVPYRMHCARTADSIVALHLTLLASFHTTKGCNRSVHKWKVMHFFTTFSLHSAKGLISVSAIWYIKVLQQPGACFLSSFFFLLLALSHEMVEAGRDCWSLSSPIAVESLR